MLGIVLGTLIALGGFALLLNWFANATPRAVLSGLRWGGIVLAGFTILALAASGRLQLLWLAMIWLLPWLVRGARLRQAWQRVKPRAKGKQSRVSTRLVDMVLDLNTGEMDGTIKEGAQAGRRLSELTTPEVLDLLLFAQGDDPHAAPLIESYLDRMRPDWRERARAGRGENGRAENGRKDQAKGPRRPVMSVEEALATLGLSGEPDEAMIKAAHRATMKRVHPDQGGSDEAAARANAAKDLLMKLHGRG